jgi:chromate transporter
MVALAFVLPSFVMVIALAHLYMHFGGGWLAGAFYGIGAAVIALITRSAVKLARMTLARNVLLWALASISALVTAITEREILWLFLGAGVIAAAVQAPKRASSMFTPAWLITGLHGPAPASVLGKIAWVFTKSGAFVFGSGLAIVPFLYDEVVGHYHWLDEKQFRDAVAVAMITPGPVVITSGFIGYLTAGIAGAMLAATCTFLPPFLVVVVAARWLQKSKGERFKAFIGGVTASAVGAIAGAAFILGRRAIVDVPTVLIALLALGVLFVKKIPEPLVIVAAGAIGLLIRSL